MALAVVDYSCYASRVHEKSLRSSGLHLQIKARAHDIFA